MGLIGPYGNRGERPKGRRRAPPSGPNWTRGAAHFSLFLSPSFLLSYSNKGRRKRGEGRRGRHHLLFQFVPAHGGGAPLEAFLSFPVWPIKAHYFPRRIPVTLRYYEKYPNHSEPFRCPNIAFQYIHLYVSTISRLLVMYVISSETPNKLRSSKTHNS